MKDSLIFCRMAMKEEGFTIEELKQLSYLIPASFVLAVVVTIIDYVNTTEFERILMSGFQKVRAVLSLIAFGSAIIAILPLIAWLTDKEKFNVTDIMKYFAVIFLLLLFFSMMIWKIISLFISKPEYNIYLKENDKWQIVKVCNNQKLLLQKNENTFKVITDYDNLLIERVWELTGWRLSYSKKNKWFRLVISVICAVMIMALVIMLGLIIMFLGDEIFGDYLIVYLSNNI